tara:strand:+ start:243 stop:590 length:348 start_codon:yes stop_codon:yes gene_type:complete
MKSTYVLEVLEFITEKEGENGWLKLGGKQKHIGYMKGYFKTQKDAVSYYNRYNPHMRSLNAHNTYTSDWDPNTKLLYIVREDRDIIATIDCFSIEDNSEPEIRNGSVLINCKWLR